MKKIPIQTWLLPVLLVVCFLSTMPFSAFPVHANAFYEYGIDVSSYQGEIDWEALKAEDETLSFAILRGGTTNKSNIDYQEDRFFAQNYEHAKENGWKVGVYFYCSAATEEEFDLCIEEFLATLDGREVEYPVFLDFEQSQAQMELGKTALTELILHALQKIQDFGYLTGIYLGYSWIDTYIDIDSIINHQFEVWMARYPYAEMVADPLCYDYRDTCSIWQYSDRMEYDATEAVFTDVNISYIDYENDQRLKNDSEIGIPYLRPTKELYYDSSSMMRSSGVKWLQFCLNQYGNAGLTVDGKFGPGTEAALIQFQAQENLPTTGICTQETVDFFVKKALEQLLQTCQNPLEVDYVIRPNGDVIFQLLSDETIEAYTVTRYCIHETKTFNDTSFITIDNLEKDSCTEYYYVISVYPFQEEGAVVYVNLQEESHMLSYRITQLQNFLLNRSSAENIQLEAYDRNRDDRIDVVDLMLLKNLYDF